MEFLDILAGYTIDILSAIILYIFFNNKKLTFNDFCKEKKKEIRNLSWGIIIITIIILIWAFSYNDTHGPSIPNLNNY